MAGRKRLKLDPRKSIFISEILSGKSGAEAARAAGVEKKSSARQAYRWQKEEGVAEEIEKGLAAIREGAAVTCETMIRQLDADRQFAIKTENASAATRSSELKAKLVGLMIDRKDVRAAHIVKAEDYKTKDVALALAALCADSNLEIEIKRTGDVPDHDEGAALRGEAEARTSASPELGVTIPIGDRGAKIIPVITAGDLRKYEVRDFADELHSFKFDRLDAEELARILPGPKTERKLHD